MHECERVLSVPSVRLFDPLAGFISPPLISFLPASARLLASGQVDWGACHTLRVLNPFRKFLVGI